MFTPKVIRVKNLKKRIFTHYVNEDTHNFSINAASSSMGTICDHLKNVTNVNAQLNIPKMINLRNILNTHASSSCDENSHYNFNNKMISSLKNVGSVTLSVENGYFVINDDTYSDNAFIVLDSHKMTNMIERIINSQDLGIFTHNVNILFDDLKKNIKSMSHIYPTNGIRTFMIIERDDTSVTFQWSEYYIIKMYVDAHNKFSVINIINVKKDFTSIGLWMFISGCIILILCLIDELRKKH